MEKSFETSNAPVFESSQYCNSVLQSDQFFLSKLLQNMSKFEVKCFEKIK